MNTTKYLQTDSRWSGLGYPRNPCTIGNSGCGEVSIVNAIIEMQKYANYTPATIVGYARQYAAPNCDGTYWSGIPAMMKNYGLTEVKEHATMPELFKELAKGDRVAIYLMGSRRGGSKGVHWTSSGHFVCSTAYKFKDGKNYVYVKDSYSNSSLRNGWISYEENMRGDVLKVWSGKLTGKLYDGTTAEEVKGTNSLDLNNSKLAVDGIGGKATVRAMQKFFGTYQDGIISGQNKNLARYYPSLQSVQYGRGGSPCIKKLQEWCGLSDPDGIIGSNTTKGWQRKLRDLGYLAKNETVDGIFGVKSMKAWQTCLNNGCKPNPKPIPTPKPVVDPLQKWYDAMTTQYNWSKNQKYEWVKPTVESSKTKGTCITFPAVALQRLGMLPSGGYFYFYPDTKKIFVKPNGWLDKHKDWFEVSYPKQTIKALGDIIKKGDIVGFDNPGYHTMVYMGKDSKGNPIFNTMGHKRGLGVTYSTYANRKVDMIVRIKKVK